jgi:hypothetical protein
MMVAIAKAIKRTCLPLGWRKKQMKIAPIMGIKINPLSITSSFLLNIERLKF